MKRSRPELIVSVRSVAEAEAALAGGCQLIDIKEPDRGALGRADEDVVLSIVAAVGGRVPVSAALGELAEFDGRAPAFAGRLDFVKWGLAGMAGRNWRESLREVALRCPAICVVAAYVDAVKAGSPSLEETIGFVTDPAWTDRTLLIDTFDKTPRVDRPLTLLDWCSLSDLARVCARCRTSDVRIALAGSLGQAEVAVVASLNPDWIAVRGAACDQRDRRRGICTEHVRALRGILEG